MKVLFYFDEKGTYHRAEKIKDNGDGSIYLKYMYKSRKFHRKKVFGKKHAKLIKCNSNDKVKTLATNFFKIVKRDDA